MPNYAFILDNADIIRQYFEKICTDEYPTYLKSAYAIYKTLKSKPDMAVLATNEHFCRQIAEYFFDRRIIALFGDYRTLLSMPHKAQDPHHHGKYMKYSDEFFGDHNILLTMDQHARPAILLRLKFKNAKKSDLMIVVQARYTIHGGYHTDSQQPWLSNTALGKATYLSNSKEHQHPILDTRRLDQFTHKTDNTGTPLYEKHGISNCASLDTKTYQEEYCIDFLNVLRNLLEGKPFFETEGLVYCPAADLIKAMHAANTIKSFIRMAPIHKAYQQYQSATKSLPGLFAQGRIAKASEAMQHIQAAAGILKLN